ncbi:hypothetical protein [Anabaena lutea]|uniref:Uncharacterized protein n=1 Tax=Anabaena lutea FACHB-196 TaxID=2692881 RepID=A0ABR8FL98_9NOST|nr:hypothetical protein [Anabaena lutea]MBD2569694.1 hypothetical protein [Anabaena lutea FACHB-196]
MRIPNTVQELLKGYRTSRKVLSSSINDVRNTTRLVNKQRLENIKLTKDLKKVSDKVLEKVPGSTAVAKAGKASLALGGIVIGLGTFGILMIDLYWLRPMLQKAQESFNNSLAKDLSKALTQITINRSKIKQLELSDQRTRDRAYALEKQIPSIKKDANDALYETRKGREILEGKISESKKQANDALYEVRAGRQILEGKIAESRKLGNDALYEVRAGRDILEAKVSEARKLGNDALYETRQGRTLLDTLSKQYNELSLKFKQGLGDSISSTIAALKADIQSAKAIAQKAETKNGLQDASINAAVEQTKALARAFDAVPKASDLFQVRSEVDLLRQTNQYQLDALTARDAALAGSINNLAANDAKLAASIDKANNKVNTPDLSPLQKELDDKFNAFVTKNNKDLNIRDLKTKDLAKSELSKEFDKRIADFEKLSNLTSEQRFQEFKKQNSKDLVQSELSKEFDKKIADFEKLSDLSADQRFKEFQKENAIALGLKGSELEKVDASLKLDINGLKQELKKVGTEINGLDTKIKEREKVDIEANQKLDKMIPLISSIPLIPGKVADTIKPSIPTLPQINTEVGKAICKSFNGGCGKQSLDKQSADINSADKANNNDLLNKLNAGANAGQLALLTKIDNKLGAQIVGGIGGKLVDGFKWLQLDRVLNVLTFAATVQNHLMLSNDIGQTLLGAFNNILQLIGIKDDKGQAVNVGEIIGNTIENIIKGIVGTENYATLSLAWSKANRIYQASTNILNSFQGLASSILNGLELVAGQNGKIGNALRKAGQVLDDAYGWMNPQPKINRITNFLEGLQQGASTIQQVTQVPLDIISQTTELTNSTTELLKVWKEDDKPENKAAPIPEPDKLKADEAAAAAASAGKETPEADLEADE